MFVKIAPDLDPAQVDVIAATLQKNRIDGVIASNTTLSRSAVEGQPHAQQELHAGGARQLVQPVPEAGVRVVRPERRGAIVVEVQAIASARHGREEIAEAMAEQWIQRLGTKRGGFRYRTEGGAPVSDAATLARITSEPARILGVAGGALTPGAAADSPYITSRPSGARTWPHAGRCWST